FQGSADDEPRSPFKKRAPLPAEEPWQAWPFLLAAAGALAASAALLWRWRRSELSRLLAPALPSPRPAFDAARDPPGSPEFRSLRARAVRAGVGGRHHCDALPLTPAELAARGAEREAIDLLEALDRARFARRSSDDESLLERARAYLKL